MLKALYQYPNDLIKSLLNSFCKYFGSSFFRHSEYVDDKRSCQFQISQSVLFEGLSNFYHAIEAYKPSIFYNNKKVSYWSSRIKFERRSQSTKWFNIELSLAENDLEIIKSTDFRKIHRFDIKRPYLFNQRSKRID